MTISNGSYDIEASLAAPWRAEAKCKSTIKEEPAMELAWDGGDANLFEDEAKKVCLRVCAVRDQCLQDALDDPQAQGIRGGYEFDMGRLPVAVARQVRREGFKLGSRQSVGRAEE